MHGSVPLGCDRANGGGGVNQILGSVRYVRATGNPVLQPQP
jgi:hypothetical protein